MDVEPLVRRHNDTNAFCTIVSCLRPCDESDSCADTATGSCSCIARSAVEHQAVQGTCHELQLRDQYSQLSETDTRLIRYIIEAAV